MAAGVAVCGLSPRLAGAASIYDGIPADRSALRRTARAQGCQLPRQHDSRRGGKVTELSTAPIQVAEFEMMLDCQAQSTSFQEGEFAGHCQ